MAYTTDDSYYAKSEDGQAFSLSSAEIKNFAGPIALGVTVEQIGSYEFSNDLYTFGIKADFGQFRDGLALSDFSDTGIGVIDVPFNEETLNNANLLKSIYAFGGDITSPANYAQDWYSDVWLKDILVRYYDGKDVTIYKATEDAGDYLPPNESPFWEFFSKSFYLRLIPSENALQPGLKNTDRFFNYVKAYPVYIRQTYSAGYETYYAITFAAANYITYITNTDPVYGEPVFGAQNSVVVRNPPTPSATLGVTGVSLSVSGNTVTATAPVGVSFTDRLVLNSKVRIRTGTSLENFFTATITALSSSAFTATITTTGTFSALVSYTYYDFVLYTPPAGSLGVYYAYNKTAHPPTGTLPSNTTYWAKVVGSFTGCLVDPIIKGWNFYLENSLFEQYLTPVPASTRTFASANVNKIINSYEYKNEIINQKQVLFNTGDYIIYNGFPFNKDSITGATMNITAGVLSSGINQVTRPLYTTTSASDLPSSDNRWIPVASDFNSYAFPASSSYNWSSHNGATSRNLSVFNDTAHTYLPNLLTGNSVDNPNSLDKKLNLATPDASIPALTAVNSLSFSTNHLMYTGFNPYKINSPTANDFTTFIVLYPDYVPSAVINDTVTGSQTDWYGIMSQATASAVLATDINNWNLQTPSAPRLSVRYRVDGTVALNLGDRVLTAIKSKNGISRPYQPMIIGLTINATDTSATLTVVDDDITRSTVNYTKKWFNGEPPAAAPTSMLYGAVPYASKLNSSKMFILEINHYYSTHDNAFFNQEIQKMDKMYAVTSGRV
jgi:hypothetical protein